MTPLPAARQAQRRTRRRRDEGTALTEFVIVMPLFILLLFWSEFFVDVGLVKLKVEEAARYALWETAAQRDPAKIQAEVIDRFRDLSSPADVHNSTPIGARAFKSINISTVSVVTNIDAPFSGNLQLNWGGSGGGILNAILKGIGNFFDRTANAIVKKMGLETHRGAQATVEFQVDNTLFPGGRIFGAVMGDLYRINDPTHAAGHLTFRAKSPVMLIDTWKAWPGPFAASNTNVNTDVYDTYARTGASAPEQEVSARAKKVAFYGASSNFVFSIMNSLIGAMGFPKPFATGTWKQDSGPICMLPGDDAKHSWVPGSGLGSQRVGNYTYPQSANALTMPVNQPEPNVDRPRSTVPSYLHTGWWGSEGGMKGVQAANLNSTTQNPYMAEYKCRDAYYLGSTVPGIKRYNNANANLTAFPLCR